MLSPSITTLDLDNLATSLEPGSVTIVASRPCWGGRYLAAQLAASYASYHGHAHVISPELTDAQYRAQYLAAARPSRLSTTTGDALFGSVDTLERIFGSYHSGLLLVDYFELLGCCPEDVPLPTMQRSLMERLRDHAREHSLVVVVSSHLNRSAEGSSTPSSTDIRIGGRDLADGLIFTHPLDERARIAGVPRGSIGVSLHTREEHHLTTVWAASDGASHVTRCA